MKLVEIKDVRVGHILQSKHSKSICVIKTTELCDIFFNDDLGEEALFNRSISYYLGEHENILNDSIIIGKLNITHKIEDNKLIEISRRMKIQKDDIVEYFDFDGFEVLAVVSCVLDDADYAFITSTGGCDDTQTFECEEIEEDGGIYTYTPQKIGIYGVTHEFVNDCEVQP